MPFRDVAIGRVLGMAAGIAATVLVVVAFVVGQLAWRGVPLDGARSPAPPLRAQGLHLQPAPQPDLARARARDAAALRETGWVDRGAGIARIPVADAMTLMAERGLRAAPVASGARP